MNRRRFIAGLGILGLGALGYRYWPEDGLFNPCLDEAIPDDLLQHDLVQNALSGIDFNQVWDCHVHLIGNGSSQKGLWIHPHMETWKHPIQHAQYLFYLDGSCVEEGVEADLAFVRRLRMLANGLPQGMKLMLLAFDYYHDETGKKVPENGPMFTSNEYAEHIAGTNFDRFEWIASIHPYREDCVEALERAVQGGARAIKWLPQSMGIDPASARCDRFYQAMQKRNIPLLVHAGGEMAVSSDGEDFGNPLKLRRPLEQGVKVIVAHCASLGKCADLDHGNEKVPCFRLFKRLMEEEQYEGKLFGDISAMLQVNRIGLPLQEVLMRREWQHRLINGSDYPLPGILPVISVRQVGRKGFLDEHSAETLVRLRRYNPLLFDLVLKRSIQWKDRSFDKTVFETRRYFTRT